MVIQSRPASPSMRTFACVLALAIGSLWWMVDTEQLPMLMAPVDLVLFAVAAAVMELLPIRQRGAGVPSSLAVVGAAAMLGAAPPVVALIAAGGWGLARVLSRRPAPAGPMLVRAIGGWALAGIASAGVALGPATWYGDVPAGMTPAAINPGAAVAVSLAIVVGVPFLDTLVRTGAPVRYLLRRGGEAIVANALAGFAIASTAVLGTLVHPVLDQWTLPTMLIPLLAARVGLDRLTVSSIAYDQTIRAMSRLPEQLGTIDPGHGVRVANLAAETALELGMDAASITDVVRASHLHELGRIQLEREAPASQRELAVAGASVIEETAELDRVARIVAAHGDLGGEAAADPDIGVLARIVTACCDVDRYAPDPGTPGQRQDVVVRLVRSVEDLDVVQALTRVLDRQESRT